MLQNQIIGVIAPKGSGKTFLSTKLIQSFHRVCIFDLMADEQWASVADDIVIGSPALFASSLHSQKFSVVYRPVRYDPKTLESEGFKWFCKLAYLRGDCLIVVDEAHQICNSHNIPEVLQVAARLGRHRKVSLLYITQSFTQVERTLTLNTNQFYFFKIIDPRDLEGIRQRCGLAVADRVQSLRKLDAARNLPGEVLSWTDQGEIDLMTSSEKKSLTAANASIIDKCDDEERFAGSAEPSDGLWNAGNRSPAEDEVPTPDNPMAESDESSGFGSLLS